MRQALSIKLVCAKHPDQYLEICPDLPKDSRTTGTEVSATFAVIPCRQCEYEKRQIIDSIDVILVNKAKQHETTN